MTTEKREAAIALVRGWLTDTSGYDKRVWPKLSRAINRNRLSYRKRLKLSNVCTARAYPKPLPEPFAKTLRLMWSKMSTPKGCCGRWEVSG